MSNVAFMDMHIFYARLFFLIVLSNYRNNVCPVQLLRTNYEVRSIVKKISCLVQSKMHNPKCSSKKISYLLEHFNDNKPESPSV